MKIQPINSIECALLHSRFAEMALPKLEATVAAQAAKAGVMGGCELKASGGGKAVYTVGNYCVSIAQSNTPLARAGFGGCLPQPITLIMMPDAEQRVVNHQAHTFISITRSPASIEKDVHDEDDEYAYSDFRDSRDSVLAMTFGYWLADAMHRNNPATAIHWLPSDHLVPPQIFELAAEGPSLTQFFVRPYLYSSAGAIGDGNPVGVVANGSQYLLDRPVIFDEAHVDYKWMIQRTTQFIDSALKNNAVLDDGAAFKVAEGEIIEVLHRGPDPGNPMGSYTLAARNIPEFGIRGGLESVLLAGNREPEEANHSRKKLDENDPIDMAILKALREREREMAEPANLPHVKDRRMGPRETHEAANFGRRGVFGKR